MKIESIVNDCLLEHTGGSQFFDAIDEKLRNDSSLMNIIINKVLDNEDFDYIIVSGKFGYALKDFCINNYLYNKIITLNGSLRTQNIEKVLNINIKDKKIVFIDDSFYLGRTRDKVKEFVEKNGATLISTYVFYDGSKNKDINVHSMYRYYDHFK